MSKEKKKVSDKTIFRGKELSTKDTAFIRGANLKSCIERYGLTQKYIAECLECDEAYVSRWITGSRKLSESFITQLLIKVPEFKNVRKDYLLGDSFFMTQEEQETASILEKPLKEALTLKGAQMLILTKAIEDVCSAENRPQPKPSELFRSFPTLTKQLSDEAIKIAWSYLHRN